jgi:predicted dehydrogenase
MNSRRLTRRTFLGAAAATLAAPAFLRARNANEKLNIAIIGAGGRGASNLAGVASENIVALCDVNAEALDKAAAKHPDAKKFTDFRKLFDHANSFDAVVVSICEHTHAFATMLALKHKKHVYCEKPLTYNIWEARRVREESAKAKVATQMGIQMHATENYHQVVELVQAGAIGSVKEVHVWVSRAWGHQSAEAAKKNNDIIVVTDRPTGSQPIPDGLDWDLWLGPAPERPFHSVYVPGPRWYRWWDFGNGTMSDLGSHWNDLPFWALRLTHPTTVEAEGPPVSPETAPGKVIVRWEFPARGELPPVKLSWYQGGKQPELVTRGKVPAWGNGVLFVGERGMLLADYRKHKLLPEADFAGYKRPATTIPASVGHHAEWLLACKTGKPTTCPFTYSGPLTESNLLGNVAYRLGKKLEWDAVNLKAKNCPGADGLLRKEYRRGWSL